MPGSLPNIRESTTLLVFETGRLFLDRVNEFVPLMAYGSEFCSAIAIHDSVSVLDMVLQLNSTVQAKAINFGGGLGAYKDPGLDDSVGHILAEYDFPRDDCVLESGLGANSWILLAEYHLISDM